MHINQYHDMHRNPILPLQEHINYTPNAPYVTAIRHVLMATSQLWLHGWGLAVVYWLLNHHFEKLVLHTPLAAKLLERISKVMVSTTMMSEMSLKAIVSSTYSKFNQSVDVWIQDLKLNHFTLPNSSCI